MKLVVAIVQSADAPALVAGLTAGGLQWTVVSTTGGFLHSGNSTILIGAEDERVDEVIGLVGTHCQARTHLSNPLSGFHKPGEMDVSPPASVEVGGGIVFVVAVERFERL